MKQRGFRYDKVKEHNFVALDLQKMVDKEL